MKKRNSDSVYGRLLLVIAVLFSATAAFGQTTEFTYQGKISDVNGQAAAYDFEFRLCIYETLSCSPPLATFSKLNVVPSSGGIFTIKVDFGSGRFSNGTDRYVEVAVRRTGETAYTVLSPRQEITSAPYALFSSGAANSLGLGGRAPSDYVLTTDPRLSPTNYVQNGTTAQTGVNFNVGGTGTANIFNAASQFNLGGSRVLSNQGQLNFFAGVDAGVVTTGGANAFFGNSAGKANTTGDNNSFFGAVTGLANTTGRFNSFFGTSSGQSNSTGNSNTFVGQSTGALNTTGSFNSFFGQGSGSTNVTGSNNSTFGANANVLQNNLTFATAIGAGATVGTSNTIVLGRTNDDVQAPGSLTAGTFVNAGTQFNLGGMRYFSNGGSLTNTYIGSTSQCGTASGSNSVNNTFVGFNTANGCTIGSGNTVVGNSAGNVGDGDNNTLIGSGARIAAGSPIIFTSTAIGALARVSKSNTLVLGIPSTNTVIKGNIQVYADQEAPGGGTETAAFESVNTTTYGRGLAANRLYLKTIANPVFTQSPICFAASSGGQIPYGIVGYCANGTGLSLLKTDIRSFEGGLQIVKRLRPVAFKWKENGETGIGLNAEDVAAVEPQLINRDEKGEVRDVKTDGLNIVLVNAIQEQQKQIEAQQKQIDALKRMLCVSNPEAEICKEKQDEE